MKKSLILFIIFILPFSLYSQWLSDARLTVDPNVSATSWNSMRCIAASGNYVYAVWHENRDGNFEIYFKRSTNSGLNWLSDTRLTNSSTNTYYPSIVAVGTTVNLIWHEQGSNSIFFRNSTDGGLTWGNSILLSNSVNVWGYPGIAGSGAFLNAVWYSGGRIYCSRSIDNGLTWSMSSQLSESSSQAYTPSVFSAGSFVHVVWYDYRDGNEEIYYKRSTNNGLNWSADTRLTNNPGISYTPCIAADNNNVHVVWHDTRDGNLEIYYKRSTNDGLNWSADTRLTNSPDTSGFPSIIASGSNVHIAWFDKRDGNGEIYYKNSTDNGLSWSNDTRLTNNSSLSKHESIAVSNTNVHVLWTDERDGNAEIYYKNNPTGNPLGIQPISNELPNQFSLSQNYPNPFNPGTNIRFQISKLSGAKLIIFDILGRETETLVNEQLKPGTYEVVWDASDYPSGVYYYKLIAEEFTQTNKMVLIK